MMNKIGEANKDFLAWVSDLMEEEEGKRQDCVCGASAQQYQGHRHQLLHQYQDRNMGLTFVFHLIDSVYLDSHKLD